MFQEAGGRGGGEGCVEAAFQTLDNWQQRTDHREVTRVTLQLPCLFRFKPWITLLEQEH